MKSFVLFRKSGGIIVSLHMLLIVLILSCCTTNNSTDNNKPVQTQPRFELTMVKPFARMDSSFVIRLSYKDRYKVDSLAGTYNRLPVEIIKNDENSYLCHAEIKRCGKQSLAFTIYYNDSLTEQHNISVLYLPSEAPKNLSYKVIRKFNHDPEAYTQGLIYINNILFESTGQWGKSSIRKVNPKNGDVLLKKPIDSEIFGEGIAVVNDKVYMLTYTSRIGFIFDTVEFNLIRKFGLQTQVGWGLTTSGTHLIMTDGSSYLYFLDPESTAITEQIEVCDDTEFIDSINELEETPNGLLANVYGKDYVIVIDKSTGIVKGKIDFKDLFPEGIPHDMDHVLNGIAHNRKTDTYYITGKLWPVMYEVKINLN